MINWKIKQRSSNESINKTQQVTKIFFVTTEVAKKKFNGLIEGINNLLNSNTSSITIYTLMMLYGTEFKERESIDLKLTSSPFFHFTLNKTLSLIKSHLIKENSFRRSLPI